LFCRRLREESGYTLVEVMVSIILLAIAILPMAAMFDMGLKSATVGSQYDKARTLANLKMEEAKSLSFSNVEANFPVSGTTYTSGSYTSAWLTESGPASADFTNFEYRVQKRYMTPPPQNPGSASQDFVTSNTPTTVIRVTVTVRWGDGNEYSTLGLVTA
jgi:prepilin-type N-terminal cleavage/methylation domain-containing protein